MLTHHPHHGWSLSPQSDVQDATNATLLITTKVNGGVSTMKETCSFLVLLCCIHLSNGLPTGHTTDDISPPRLNLVIPPMPSHWWQQKQTEGSKCKVRKKYFSFLLWCLNIFFSNYILMQWPCNRWYLSPQTMRCCCCCPAASNEKEQGGVSVSARWEIMYFP